MPPGAGDVAILGRGFAGLTAGSLLARSGAAVTMYREGYCGRRPGQDHRDETVSGSISAGTGSIPGTAASRLSSGRPLMATC